LEIGALRHRVSIETVSTFQDAYGQTGEALAESTTTPFATVWGEVADLSGSEPLSAEQLHSQITTRITIRFYPGISPAMLARVSMDQRTRTFDILAVRDPDGRRYILELDAKERFD
jgi:SPP1 family predicted phage head-tail adaptor